MQETYPQRRSLVDSRRASGVSGKTAVPGRPTSFHNHDVVATIIRDIHPRLA